MRDSPSDVQKQTFVQRMSTPELYLSSRPSQANNVQVENRNPAEKPDDVLDEYTASENPPIPTNDFTTATLSLDDIGLLRSRCSNLLKNSTEKFY